MKKSVLKVVLTCMCVFFAGVKYLHAQDIFFDPSSLLNADTVSSITEDMVDVLEDNTASPDVQGPERILPSWFFRPAVFDHYEFPDKVDLTKSQYSGDASLKWLEDAASVEESVRYLRHSLFFKHPELVKYNYAMLPEAPRAYEVIIDPRDYTVAVQPVKLDPVAQAELMPMTIKKRHWIRVFNVSLQFSQAYISPNWYQGGNNNLNVLGQIYYDVKLNKEYHPNLMFETTAQYKVGLNSSPDDSIHRYNVSEDLLQITSTFGVKAARRWYYSVNALFKTQLINSYNTNSRIRRSAFLSPSELNAGLGMTYSYTNPRKTVDFNMSIAPLSYNLKTCINRYVDPLQYGIAEGSKTMHKFGSSAEFKLTWKICYNIQLLSRLFAFTDYSRVEVDWENTLIFDINRFLTTQVYAHARYDSSTPRIQDTNWHKLQLKEVLSIGFAYKFSSI
ncbi:MAG: DUF3078 domain-containing protein [Muribaculaceae bacterium]|nr:DUF3078 domain-containing protein [Muribaculaceae bacterium]